MSSRWRKKWPVLSVTTYSMWNASENGWERRIFALCADRNWTRITLRILGNRVRERCKSRKGEEEGQGNN